MARRDIPPTGGMQPQHHPLIVNLLTLVAGSQASIQPWTFNPPRLELVLAALSAVAVSERLGIGNGSAILLRFDRCAWFHLFGPVVPMG